MWHRYSRVDRRDFGYSTEPQFGVAARSVRQNEVPMRRSSLLLNVWEIASRRTLLRNFQERRHQAQAQLGCATVEVTQYTSPILLFIVIGTKVMIRFTLFQHEVDDPSQFMGGGGDSRRCHQPGSHAAKKSRQGTVAGFEAGRGDPQSSAGSILGWLHTRLYDLAAGDLVVGAQTQPGSKMLH